MMNKNNENLSAQTSLRRSRSTFMWRPWNSWERGTYTSYFAHLHLSSVFAAVESVPVSRGTTGHHSWCRWPTLVRWPIQNSARRLSRREARVCPGL